MKRSPSSILLFEEAQKRGLNPVWKTTYGLFQCIYHDTPILVYQTKHYGNSQFSAWLTGDKHATHVLLEDHGLPGIPYQFMASPKELETFFRLHQPLIAKPVLGEMSKQVVLVTKRAMLLTFERETTIFEKFINGYEYRVMLLKGRIAAIQEKIPDPAPGVPWRKKRHNLTESQWDPIMADYSQQIHRLIPQEIMAVDFIKDTAGAVWVLEINSMPGLWSFAHPHAGEPIHLAPMVLDIIIKTQWTKK